MMTLKIHRAALAALLPLAVIATPALADNHPAKATALYAPITQGEVEAAQQAWCGALVAIATEYDAKGLPAAKALAGRIIDGAYGYAMGPVLFKPTLTVAPQTFRTTREGALAYFVGDDKVYPKDTGFALKGWRKCQAENAGLVITGNTAISMGNVSMWDAKGNMTKVDKTWAWTRGADGNLKIVLHHSSLPYIAP
jgi:hypothetical protein